MDETSWQLALLKAGINITNINTADNLVYFDFAYRPNPGGPRVWGKSVYRYTNTGTARFSELSVELKRFVLALRKELEG